MRSNIKMKFEDNLYPIREKDIVFSREILPSHEFILKVCDLLYFNKGANGFLFFCDLHKILLSKGYSKIESKFCINSFRKNLVDNIFKIFYDKIPEIINPLNLELNPYEFFVEGFNINNNFQDSGIDFYSTKQLHFDIVEPLSSNLYGLNKNISGGLPVFADCKMYCKDKGLKIIDIVEKIPGNRIITLKKDHYLNVLEKYSFAYDLEMTNDLPFSIYLNGITEIGILHGATNPVPIDNTMPSERPIIHYSYDNHDAEATELWYKKINFSVERRAGNPSKPKPLLPEFSKKNINLKIIKIKQT